MTVAEDVKQAIQAFLVPELDAIKAQIAEVRGVQSQMSERLSEQAAQILAQRREVTEAMARLESRMDGRMDRIEFKLETVKSDFDTRIDRLDASLNARMDHLDTSLSARMEYFEKGIGTRMDRIEDKMERQSGKMDQIIMLLSPQNRAIG
uniref:Uncharacterized protein n=1 Tax=mine drainage metagenome TaxID=410659 RepID=E6QLT9_9ZZZZ